MQELLCKLHDGYPCRLFLMLEDPGLADCLAAGKPCARDSFSEAFVQHFEEDGLASPIVLACLSTSALGLRLDIADIAGT